MGKPPGGGAGRDRKGQGAGWRRGCAGWRGRRVARRQRKGWGAGRWDGSWRWIRVVLRGDWATARGRSLIYPSFCACPERSVRLELPVCPVCPERPELPVCPVCPERSELPVCPVCSERSELPEVPERPVYPECPVCPVGPEESEPPVRSTELARGCSFRRVISSAPSKSSGTRYRKMGTRASE